MACFASEVSFEPVAWSDQVAGDLLTIAACDVRELDIFKERVDAGDFQVMEARHKGERVGTVVWSVEQELDGQSIVINAAAAKPIEGVCVVTALHKNMMELGRVLGARSVRCWTRRAGLVRKLEALGAIREYVMEIEL